ncbi:MAG: general secretion pathway protein GspB [Desulfuromonadales bacterium]
MSYILDALKKVDQEREFDAVPGLATPHEVGHKRRRPPRWPWVLAALLSVNVVLVTFLLLKSDAEAPDAAQAMPEWQEPAEDDAMQLGGQGPKDRTGPEPAPGRTAPPREMQPFSIGELAASPKPLNSRNPELLLQPEDAAETRFETASSANSAPQLQSWYELPQEIRMRLSLPRLDLHVYSEEPQNRFILVNLQKYREGETLESGLVLEEILPEGMVMSYLGERFMVEK